MKKSGFAARAALSFLAAALTATACFDLAETERDATIRIFFEGFSPTLTRASGIPDTDDFILTVSDIRDSCIWTGRFGDSPESIQVSPGVYTISAVSGSFSQPAYECPQYGDTKVVVADSGDCLAVALNCSQLNCGIRLSIDRDFETSFPEADIYLKDEVGTLMYSYGESRTAYMNPGAVSVVMGDKMLFSRRLEARQMLSLTLSGGVSSGNGTDDSEGSVEIQVDTTREWIDDRYSYGQEGQDSTDALSIQAARDAVASGESSRMENVWVCGYIVGCASSTSKVQFDGPFTKATNIVLGERSSTVDRANCLSVELPSGTIRDSLNLCDNPSMKGRRIRIRGNLVPSYYGLPGLKSPTAFDYSSTR